MKKLRKIKLTNWQRRSLISFSVFAVFICSVYMLISKVSRQDKIDGVPSTLRHTLEFNKKVFSTQFTAKREATAFTSKEAAPTVRRNGTVGVKSELDTSDYSLIVISGRDTLSFSMAQIRSLPSSEVIFDFKCIEGWSQVTHWRGVRFSDFIKQFHLGTKSGNIIQDKPNSDWYKYVGLSTPDEEYYVGIDMPSMMHVQTILCYDVNNIPLPFEDGAPLRLIIPVKYGVKHLKRIGTIYFSDQPPPDYWAERGYDYYGGL